MSLTIWRFICFSLVSGFTTSLYVLILCKVHRKRRLCFSFAEIVKVCKCMNNVFVQCELWCEEILRRVARPCCTCSRHVSSQALEDLMPLGPCAHFSPGATSTFVPGLEVSVVPCPSTSGARGIPPPICPGMIPETGPCSNLQHFTHTYMMHEAQHSMFMWPRHERPSRLTRPAQATTRTPLRDSLPAPAFLHSTSTEMNLSSPSRIDNCFKSSEMESHKRLLVNDTRDSSSPNILQSPIATSSCTVHSSSPSSDDSRKPFLSPTLPAQTVGRDVDADCMQKVRYRPSSHDTINRQVLRKPSSLFSSSCKSFHS